ncbi:SRPBCC family protein [Bauldia sp.]|uniref:SRPBCC family protein n=1 Tax=Bauldia sp. TaxID=2575872 RepID=UPI003BAB5C07
MPSTLEIATPTDREIVMTRSFAAPRALVFDAWTKPDLVRQWLGTNDWPMAVCEADVRPGGAIRYVWRHADGQEMGMSGMYREITEPERIVHTELFDEDWTGGETTVTTTFDENADTTTVTTRIVYASMEARDAVMRSPMEQGVAEGYNRLDALLPSLTSP